MDNSDKKRNIKTLTILELAEKFRSGKLALPPYQRNFVWSEEQQKQLIHSVFDNRPIGIVCLAYPPKIDGISQMRRIEDGQQRITTFSRFLDNKFSLGYDLIHEGINYKGKFYKDIPENLSERFTKYEVPVEELSGFSILELRMRFVSLQNATQLTTAEKRRAVNSEVNAALEEIIESNSFIVNILATNNKRYEKEQMLGEMLYLVSQPNLTDPDFFKSLDRGPELMEFWLNYAVDSEKEAELKNLDLKKIVKKLNTHLNNIENCIKNYAKIPKIHKAVLGLCVFLFETLNRNKIKITDNLVKQIGEQLHKFYIDPEKGIQSNMWEVLGYGTSPNRIYNRYKLFVDYCFANGLNLNNPNLKEVAKDSKRLATKNNANLVKIQQDMKCAECGCDLYKHSSEIDHIQEHAIGGKTELNNLQALCKICHQNKTAEFIKKQLSREVI